MTSLNVSDNVSEMRKDRLPPDYPAVLPCKCGNAKIEIHWHQISHKDAPWRLWCSKCGTSSSYEKTEKEACIAWNKMKDTAAKT